jgi:hypothetical protein
MNPSIHPSMNPSIHPFGEEGEEGGATVGRRRRGGLDRGRAATRSGLGGGDARGGRRGGPATVSGLGDGSGQGVAAAWRRRARWFGVGAEERERKKIGEEEENFLSRAYILAPLVPVGATNRD